MKVKDHKKFCCFDYESSTAPHVYQLGDIVTKESEDGIEIGVVIQLHEDGDFRTDMFGNASPSEVTLSTVIEVLLYRKELLEEVVFELTLEQTRQLFDSGRNCSDYGFIMNTITKQKIF